MKNNKSGQVLLVAVLLIATVLTVTLTLTLKSTTETQLTKLEEDSQKTLSAAEAAVEAALQSDTGSATFGTGGLTDLSNFEGGAALDTVPAKQFVAPLLQKNQQYTYYLNTPDFTNPWTPDLDIYFESQPDTQVALEFTFIRLDDTIHRYVIDPHNKIGGAGDVTANAESNNIGGFPFGYRVRFTITQPHKLLIVRVLNDQTRIAFKDHAGADLRPQGKTVVSTATSGTGVTKKVQLFQSYPQIPASFFVTSF